MCWPRCPLASSPDSRSAPGSQRLASAGPGPAGREASPVSSFPGSPKLLRGGLVQLDPGTSAIIDVIVFQYNPDTVTRTLQPRAMTGEPGDRLEVLRLTGPPHETIKLDAELDAADQLESRPIRATRRSSRTACCPPWPRSRR